MVLFRKIPDTYLWQGKAVAGHAFEEVLTIFSGGLLNFSLQLFLKKSFLKAL
ncbi:hypothetical protein ACVR0W_05510 [Streptococcus canis]|uniref:Mannose-6-phosphate isomerase n=1 Tax=Streptococcus canis FSL Z3-227 TaxID=482234 RepID=A0AAV3FUQ8_STRCB|nr:hypothetical protein [Streptococcus canis]EIQ82872.1 hypothetical protein SCAZ3_10935 [Streptococcus canis FSL Z3-227]MDV5988381.1 hypothetical protein [Streptococcus canis]MDV5992857.1 hypothetical protein [Streptococcus canis]VEE24553.1 Uncharacterised protein [Streptococcus canis]VTS75467.1 Uncharacterised protein [Streptococcus canis]